MFDGKMHLSTTTGRNGQEIAAAERGFVSEDVRYWISIGYYREHEPDFPEIAREICASLRFTSNGR